ncbi:(d)CMP kinase [Rhodococcus sp. X156]|uniref:(d)CMP kinase n=1 Tax=Rhodococcus sp. X156 TaxID=2499145 RepID=UPI000FD9D0D9|nr:(d)CMP kinase [Rhodococcus sp. X156]
MDGPSGTGKSTVARRLATDLGAQYLDTGAMYRTATLQVLRAHVDLGDPDAIDAATTTLALRSGTDPAHPTVQLGDEDVSAEIRGAAVTQAVSAVSAVPALRVRLVALQREIVRQAPHGMVVEGRDIGTVVLPDADLKVYLTASAEDRAQRRAKQDAAEGRPSDYEAVLADVQRRDHLDSTRATSPLRPAEDAVTVDTSGHSIDEVLTRLRALVASTSRTEGATQ